jgi:hypothetical protein
MRDSAARALRPALPAALAAGLMIAAIYFGSGRLAHFDAALAGYCGATVIACFATAYQVAALWQRRASAFYGRVLLSALRRPRQVWLVVRTAGRDIAAQRFIARRSRVRWLAHMLLAWGTLIGCGVTLPLVWGWLHFEIAGDRLYRAMLFSLPVARFATDGVLGWLIFHALHLAAAAVVLGATCFLLARARTRRQPGVIDGFHLVPLLLLLAVALSGLALPVAAHTGRAWFHIAAIGHEATVIALLVALPYGKLIHLFIRPLHLGAQLMRSQSRAAAHCGRCQAAMAPAVQLQGVEAMLAERGFRFEGYQQLCPTCRRTQLAAVHSHLLGAQFQPQPAMRRVALRKAA